MKQMSGSEFPVLKRSSFGQIMKKERLACILEFLLRNSSPAAQREKDVVALKQSSVCDKTLRSFYE